MNIYLQIAGVVLITLILMYLAYEFWMWTQDDVLEEMTWIPLDEDGRV